MALNQLRYTAKQCNKTGLVDILLLTNSKREHRARIFPLSVVILENSAFFLILHSVNSKLNNNKLTNISVVWLSILLQVCFMQLRPPSFIKLLPTETGSRLASEVVVIVILLMSPFPR